MDAAGKVSTHLVMSKSRVAPTKTVSLPRLGLLAAVINSRLLKFVAASLCLKLDRVVKFSPPGILNTGNIVLERIIRLI